MAEYLHPGVYVEEYDSGAVPMQGVSTSTAGFVGYAERGPVVGQPQFVTSFADYKRIYGGYLSQAKYGDTRYLPYAVEQFFLNGGSRAYIMRVADPKAQCAKAASGVLEVKAANPGAWGDMVRVTVAPASKAKTQVLEANGADLLLKNPEGFNAGDVVELFDGTKSEYLTVKSALDKTITLDAAPTLQIADATIGTAKFIRTCELNVQTVFGDQVEAYENVSINPYSANYIGNAAAGSKLAVFTVNPQAAPAAAPAATKAKKAEDGKDAKKEEPAPAPAAAPAASIVPYDLCGGLEKSLTIALAGGSDGSVGKVDAATYVGTDNGPGNRTGLQAFIENSSVSIMLIPGITDATVQANLVAFCENKGSCFAILDAPLSMKTTNDLSEFRDKFDSSYAALYHPWVEMLDGDSRRPAYFPPSGCMAGIYARTDNERGVYKAPANETVSGCTGLSCLSNDAEQDILNPIGVNLIRSFTGRGIRVWGGRTLSSNGLWKYVSVRRLFIYVEESIKANTNWVVFEPNSETLWLRVTQTISGFLAGCWRDGALAGSSTDQAFFVECGLTTMTQDDIDNGRLICSIGIAPVKPAEFVIFRITQKTAYSS